VNNEYNFKPIDTGCIGIEKNRKTGKVMIQTANYSIYEEGVAEIT
jgi:hypothetical protein